MTRNAYPRQLTRRASPQPIIPIAIFVVLGFEAARPAEAAVYSYSFGTGTGTYTTSTASETFLPAPPSGGGTARVRAGSASGSFALNNPGILALGTGSELASVTPTSGSYNKFSIYDYADASRLATLSLSVVLSGTSGTTYLMTGNGSFFNDNNQFSSTQSPQIFAGLRFTFAAGSGLTTDYRSGSGWATTGLTTSGFVKGSVLRVDIVQNNSAAMSTYNYVGTSATVGVGKYDVYVNGTLAGNDLTKGEIASTSTIDSFILASESASTANSTTVTLDDISYSSVNDVSTAPEPMTAALFTVGGMTALNGRRRRLHSSSM